MKFGKSADEAAQEPTRGGDYIRYLKDGDTTWRMLEEPDDWTYYWEHYNPGGYSFPCTNERDTCPGCTSEIEKMKKASRKIAFNVLQSYNGEDYVNVYKVPQSLADKFKNRFERSGTLLDKDYTVTRYKSASDRVDYDLEGGDKSRIDVSKHELKNIEAMLEESYNQSWGDPLAAKESEAKAAEATEDKAVADKVKSAAAHSAQLQSEEPPFKEPEADSKAEGEDIVVSERDLRKLDAKRLRSMCVEEYDMLPPSHDPNEIVDWMMQQI